MKIKLHSEFVGAQYDFMSDTTTKFLHLSAGYGFGKTRTLCYKALDLSWRNKDLPGGLVVPSYTDFTRDVKVSMEDIFNDHNIDAKFHGQEHSYSLPWTSGKLFVATAEKKIRGPNWGYACINELTLLKLESYREVIGRVRVKGASNPQIASSGTPEGIASAYYEIFVEKPWQGSKVLYGDTRDNAHNLDSSFVQSLYDSYPQAMLDAYLKGLWVNLSGNRFYFSYDPKINDVENKPDPDLQYHCALDFNVDPMCASIWQDWGGKIVALDEICLEGGEGYKTENMVTALRVRGYVPQNTIIYPDPAGASRSTKGAPDNEILRRAGYQVRAKSVAPRFRERQINSNNGFEKRKIEIHPKLKGLKKDLLAVELDPVTLEKVKKNPKLTHFSDGFDYFYDIISPFRGHGKATETTRLR